MIGLHCVALLPCATVILRKEAPRDDQALGVSFGGKRFYSWPLWGRTTFWRGGSVVHHDENIERFYTTRIWRSCRQSFLVSRDGLCEICMKKGLIRPAVHVHHKQPITLNHANLMALCEECHQEQHRKKRWRCDARGHVSL